MIQRPAWRLRQFPQTRVHSLLRIPRQKPCTRHRCCCRILHPTSGHQAQVAAGSLAAGPAPNVDGTSHVCGLCRPGLQCELRACCTTDCHSHRPSLRCPRPSPMLQPHCSRTLHRCQHSWKLRWTQTHHRCCRPAPRQMPTPFELHRSCCQCRQLLKTESVIHPVSRSRVEGGNRGVSWSFSYRWQHVHWAPVAPHRKR